MFDDYRNLRPLKGAANILAEDDSWGPLYDLEQLSKNEVKVSAVSSVFSYESKGDNRALTSSEQVLRGHVCGLWAGSRNGGENQEYGAICDESAGS